MLTNIKIWLKTTGYEVEEELFFDPPALPYILFTESVDIRGCDSKNCVADRSIIIELYSEEIDHEAEKKVEDLLNEKAVEYSKERTWIKEEMFFQTLYDFNLIEKF